MEIINLLRLKGNLRLIYNILVSDLNKYNTCRSTIIAINNKEQKT